MVLFSFQRFEPFFKKRLILSTILVTFLLVPDFGFSDDFLCRPWSNVVTGDEIGNSFSSQIKNGQISFLGDNRPIAFAQLIYSHPLNDIFMAASGEIVTAGFEDQRIRINVYFPNKEVNFFVTASCGRM